MKRILVLSFAIAFLALSFAINCFAKEITILYSGETHAMLYPCDCPKEPDGGIARRATLIKQLKKKYPDALVLDSGGFFAAGLMDEYVQNTDLDMQRSKVNLKAMELMGYTAAAIGDDELNFGEKFFQENAEKTNLPFLSCNLKADKVSPYMIKEAGGAKIGIIGLTGIEARKKCEKFQVLDAKAKLIEAIHQLKKDGADIIVVLSHLNENEESNILNDVPGISIFIAGHSRAREGTPQKFGDTIILRPAWQGRSLGSITFSIKDKRIVNYKTEDSRLSDKISDDPQILSMRPRCFSDSNCKKEGMVGICQNPGSLSSSCLFSEAHKINLMVVTAKSCATCNSEGIIKSLKKYFPGLTVTYFNYPDSNKARMFVRDFGINGLPAYIFDKKIEKEPRFNDLKESMDAKDGYYLLKPEYFGYSYLIERKRIKGKLDMFVSLFDQDKPPAALLEVLRPLNPDIHFLVAERDFGFKALKGTAEVEEALRSVCVQKYYPEIFFDYISCRAKNINSSWWEDCLGKRGASTIKACAQSEEGRKLLKENIALGKELGIMFGPTCLTENQEISSCSASKNKRK